MWALTKGWGQSWARGMTCGVLLSLLAAPLCAQNLDPAMIQRMQQQLGVNNSLGSVAPQVDQSRRAGEADATEGTVLSTAVRETPEEVELRRLRSRDVLDRMYKPSLIEQDFQNRARVPGLRQFGYDLFKNAPTSAGPVNGEIGSDYVLGIGDEVVVTFQGANNQSFTTRVDRAGRLVIGLLPPIQAAGRSLAAVKSAVEAQTRRTLLGTDVFLSVGAVRTATVFVGGEVERPGQYSMTSMSDVMAALARAGGVRKTGSLRHVRLVRDGATQIVDLYGLLGIGVPVSVRLRDGDRIIVPVLGPTVAVIGNVARPAIFELAGGTSVGDLISYAGGASRYRGYRASLARITEDGAEQFLKVSGMSQSVVAGDMLVISNTSAGGARGGVALFGNVSNAGVRALADNPTVRQLLGSRDALLPDTYQPMAILIRRNAAVGTRSFLPVNLLTALGDGDPVALQDGDELILFQNKDIEFMNSTAVRNIVLGGKAKAEDCRSLMRLQQLISDTMSTRYQGLTRGTLLASETAQAVERTMLRTEKGDMAENEQQEIIQKNLRQSLQSNNDGNNKDQRADVQLALLPEEAVCPLTFELYPDLLPLLIENAVGVGGVVRRPGAYPIAGSVTAEVIAAVGEGLPTTVSGLFFDVTRAGMSNQGVESYQLDDAEQVALRKVSVKAGDFVRFNGDQAQLENGAVLVSGEFARPGLYAIRKGETLSQLIARAGGMLETAYPYGAIFTRRSVKKLQEEGFRRQARELNSSLLAIATRKETGGDAIAAVGALIERLATAETPGRMVVEADPRVLEIRSDLDTILEAGDTIYVPKKPNFVVTLGDVSNPGAQQFVGDKRASDYIAEAGGPSSTADRKRAFIVYPNGAAKPLKGSFWRSGATAAVPPGSTIIVPKNVDPLYKLGIFRDVSTIFAQLATAVASLVILTNNN